ncbi:MAG: ABC transporter ATP-binding protein [Candidatus Methanomethylophilaceae archaeon]|nr:ABC transporter ATP-binding protein [Candidatus Methanomethylophilaceae archaeon]
MIFGYMTRRDRLMLVPVVVLVIFQVYLDLKIPEYMQSITYALQVGTTSALIVEDGWKMILCALASFAASLCAGALIALIASSLSRTLRNELYSKVCGFSSEDVAHFSAASLITRVTGDVKEVQTFVSTALQTLIKSPILAVWAIAKISGGGWEWTAVTAASVIFLVSAISLITALSVKYFRRAQVLTDSLNDETRESILGSKVVRAYNAEDFQGHKFQKASEDMLDNYMGLFHVRFALFLLPPVVTNFLTMAIYWIGAVLISGSGAEDVQMRLFSDMVAFSSYGLQVLGAFMLIADFIKDYPHVVVSIRRVEDVLRWEPTVKYPDPEGPAGPGCGRVEFRNVTFRYPGTKRDSLSGVSFSVGEGQTLGIIGRTGSGKITVARLLLRNYDVDGGAVLVDGMDVRSYPHDDLRGRMACAFQEPFIFSGTVRENVDFGNQEGSRSDSDVWASLGIAQAEEFVRAMPQGLDSVLLSGGKNLSGGQRQRLSIARAVCKGSRILILDDSFSALDMSTDAALGRALRESLADRTKIIISQRVRSIIDADEILVLDGGRVVGLGTHEELLGSCPVYAEIVRTQMEVWK